LILHDRAAADGSRSRLCLSPLKWHIHHAG
jgi:hypothetical protein